MVADFVHCPGMGILHGRSYWRYDKKKDDMAERVIAKIVHPSNENIALASGSGNILILRVNIFGYHPLGHVIFL